MNSAEPRNQTTHWIVLAIAVSLPTAVTWFYFVALDGADKHLQQGAYSVGKTIQFALPIAWLILLQKQFPKWPKPTARGLLTGGLLGLAIAASMLALYFYALKPSAIFAAPAAAVRLKVQSMGIRSPAAFIALGLFYSLFHSLLEEYYWRWFVFRQLRHVMAVWPAIVISAIGFTLHHVIVLSIYFGIALWLVVLLSSGVAIGGAFWAWLFNRSDSVFDTWFSHLLIDAGIFFGVGFELLRHTFVS
jgi:membrane protease YdiL (CAAX protease family)